MREVAPRKCHPIWTISPPIPPITTKPDLQVTLPSVTWILDKPAADGSPFWPPKAKRSLKACLIRRVQIKCSFQWLLSLLTFTVPPASLAGHHPGRASSVQTLEGFRVLQLPLCLAFPRVPQFGVLFYMGKDKDFIFIKCLNSLFDINLIFQRCQIPWLPPSSNTSLLWAPGQQGWHGQGARLSHGTRLLAGRAHCLSREV